MKRLLKTAALITASAVALAFPAGAVQLETMLQGYLTNATGTPITTAQTADFKVFQGGSASTAGSGTLVYEETGAVSPTPSGVFSYLLGGGTPTTTALSTSTFDTPLPVYVEVSLNGTVLLPRIQLTGMPYAAIAGVAETIKQTSVIVASSATLAGNLTVNGGIIASTGTFTGTGSNLPSVTTSSGIVVLSGAVTAPSFVGTFSGSLAPGTLPPSVAYNNADNGFSASQTIYGGITAATATLTAAGANQPSLTTSSGIVVNAGGLTAPFVAAGAVSGTFYGDGSHITGLQGSIPIGGMIMWPSATEPTGWIECDGRTLPQSGTFAASWGSFNTAALFSAIGTVWGSAGAGEFNIPDLRGIFPRGWDHGKTGTYSDPDAGSRVAQYTSGTASDNVGSYETTKVTNPAGILYSQTGQNPLAYSTFAGAATSSGNEVRPTNASVMFIIRVQ